MPPQHVEVAETVAALKRALRREKEAPSDQPTYSATNRGNKMKRGASYIHAGALPYPHGPEGYKQKIDHAGFTRYILDRNPKRYNEYGDELEDSESDTEADADAYEENAYSGVRLEELLCPLKHPSELATHPTLSLPFLDPALPDLVQTTEEKLRQERANLWRAKNLNRQFIGDEAWKPCGSVESNNDWDLFEPRPKVIPGKSKKRKRTDNLPAQNRVNGQDRALPTESEGSSSVTIDAPQDIAQVQKAAPSVETESTKGLDGQAGETAIEVTPAEDTDMTEAEPTTNGIHIKKDPHEADEENTTNMPATNGTDKDIEAPLSETVNSSASNSVTPPTPPRRITRALAAEKDAPNAPTPPLSPANTVSSTVASSLLTSDPLFLIPSNLSNSQRLPSILSYLGLPIDELLDTRRLLTMYIQKQEESVRGYEAVLGKLVKAKRLRETLWEWCKAEGHVGEWSDGEDWVDAEAWGVGPGELKKGKDEEEVEGVEEVGVGGRKGKRRRNRE